MTWKPIETAKVFTILGWNGRSIDVWTWDPDAFSKRPRPCWRRFDLNGITRDREEPPTHWMPLPAPPEPGA